MGKPNPAAIQAAFNKRGVVFMEAGAALRDGGERREAEEVVLLSQQWCKLLGKHYASKYRVR